MKTMPAEKSKKDLIAYEVASPPYRYTEADVVTRRPEKELSNELPWPLPGKDVSEWYKDLLPQKNESKYLREAWVAYRMFRAAQMIQGAVEVDPDRCGGVPVIRGTRFSVSRVLSQIADGDSVDVLVEEFDLNKDDIVDCLHAIAISLDRSLKG